MWSLKQVFSCSFFKDCSFFLNTCTSLKCHLKKVNQYKDMTVKFDWLVVFLKFFIFYCFLLGLEAFYFHLLPIVWVQFCSCLFHSHGYLMVKTDLKQLIFVSVANCRLLNWNVIRKCLAWSTESLTQLKQYLLFQESHLWYLRFIILFP